MNKFNVKYVLIALAVLITVAYSARLESEQTELSRKLIRLRVVANSDSDADQKYKIEIRDRILTGIAPILSGATGSEEAAARLRAAIPALAQEYPDCEITLQRRNFPEREYDTFTLPAGEYNSLQITIGAGKGENWWCVLFPPLCVEAVSAEDLDAEDAFAMLGDEQVRFIKGKSGEYKIKFRILEIIAEIKSRLGSDSRNRHRNDCSA
ncbi:MAG: stage II sporulation protein R [Oscillospiraceae bacterium]|jgi:stage II sporulation protein R|nr:stage II sporulation protein R [Oscillospiraceae bacterium]